MPTSGSSSDPPSSGAPSAEARYSPARAPTDTRRLGPRRTPGFTQELARLGLRGRLRFAVERFLLRGPQYRLLLIAALIGGLSMAAGILVLPSGSFESYREAVWWAFLRLSDPGYLGDDQGTWVRTVSTVLTVLGYVVFLGSLVAIMTQWLNATMARLEAGTTPVRRKGHVVILGWTNRTVAMVRELLVSEERVHRFLRDRHTRDLHVVILAEEVNARVRQELRDRLGTAFDESRIVLRSGSPLRQDHLARTDLSRAAAVLIPGSDLGPVHEGLAGVDARTLKTLLTLERLREGSSWGEGGTREEPAGPAVVAEIHDDRRLPLARRAYRGKAEFLVSDAVLSRLLVQNLVHPGLSAVYGELLSQNEGNELYLPRAEGLDGARFGALDSSFPEGVVLGLVRSRDGQTLPYLNPPEDFPVEAGDRVVVMARRWGDVAQPVLSRGAPGDTPVEPTPGPGTPPPGSRPAPPRRLLLLGWSRKAPGLLRELAAHRGGAWEVTVVSRVESRRRSEALERLRVEVPVRHIHGDFTMHEELLRSAPLEHDGIILLGSERPATPQEADARTLLGALLLQDLLDQVPRPPTLLVELLEPGNVALLPAGSAEVLVTPILMSHILAQVALRGELRSVFDQLFTARGPEIAFLPATEAGLAGTFRHGEACAALRARGRLLLGMRESGQAPWLNPPRDRVWQAGETELVTLGEGDPKPLSGSGV
jgi:uncharacterized membrane protein YgdD (TMEM256/DUF423 family)